MVHKEMYVLRIYFFVDCILLRYTIVLQAFLQRISIGFEKEYGMLPVHI